MPVVLGLSPSLHGVHADGDNTVSLVSFRMKQIEKSCKGQEEGEWRARVTILGSAQVLSPPHTQITQRTECEGLLGIRQVGTQA